MFHQAEKSSFLLESNVELRTFGFIVAEDDVGEVFGSAFLEVAPLSGKEALVVFLKEGFEVPELGQIPGLGPFQHDLLGTADQDAKIKEVDQLLAKEHDALEEKDGIGGGFPHPGVFLFALFVIERLGKEKEASPRAKGEQDFFPHGLAVEGVLEVALDRHGAFPVPDLGWVVKAVQSRPQDFLPLLAKKLRQFVGKHGFSRATEPVNANPDGVGQGKPGEGVGQSPEGFLSGCFFH